jgi:hypothetical protein
MGTDQRNATLVTGTRPHADLVISDPTLRTLKA